MFTIYSFMRLSWYYFSHVPQYFSQVCHKTERLSVFTSALEIISCIIHNKYKKIHNCADASVQLQFFHSASPDENGNYTATIRLSTHKDSYGTFIIHSYVQTPYGKNIFQRNASVARPAPVYPDGWVQTGGNWYYYLNNVKQTGWLREGDNLYYLNSDGTMAHDQWMQENGEWYYLRNWGAALNCGWSKIDIDWYWFDSDCTMRRDDWMTVDGNLYYLRDWGGMLYNQWRQKDGEWYYFRSWGAALNCGWSKIGIDWYWFDKDCTMAHDQWIRSGNNSYYLRGWGGRMYNQWATIDGKRYYFRSDGTCA